MTYRELRDNLNAHLEGEYLDAEVSVVLLETREAIPAIDFIVGPWKRYPATDSIALGLDIVAGVLDEDFPFLTIDA